MSNALPLFLSFINFYSSLTTFKVDLIYEILFWSYFDIKLIEDCLLNIEWPGSLVWSKMMLSFNPKISSNMPLLLLLPLSLSLLSELMSSLISGMTFFICKMLPLLDFLLFPVILNFLALIRVSYLYLSNLAFLSLF